MMSRDTFNIERKLHKKQRELKDRPSAKWLEREIKDLEIKTLKSKLADADYLQRNGHEKG